MRQLTLCTLLTLAFVAAAAAADKPRHWYTPWRKAPVTAPVAVIEVGLAGASAAAVQQYWQRNTLRIDLTAVSGSGTLALKPNPANGWPVRLEFAVRPGSFQQLEVRGEKRVLFPVGATANDDGSPQVLPLGMGVYTRDTRSIELRWN